MEFSQSPHLVCVDCGSYTLVSKSITRQVSIESTLTSLLSVVYLVVSKTQAKAMVKT